ncbi:hypothetical protein ACHAQA_008926 [Verticillium albo-atrum]
MNKIVGLITLLAMASFVTASPTSQFDNFFPSWNAMLQKILRDNCSAEYDEYRTGKPDPDAGASHLVTPVLNCVLEQFPEFRKAELSASAVILGSLPIVLQTLGSTTAETALVGMRRPGLALLLAAGSPAVVVVNGATFVDAAAGFVHGASRESARLVPGPRIGGGGLGRAGWAVSFAEYVLAGLAVANGIQLAYELGVNAVVVFAPETIFMVPLWTFLAVVIHFAAVLALLLRVRVVRRPRGDRRGAGFGRWVPGEFVPAACRSRMELAWREGSVLFHVLSWVLTCGTVAHVIFGTLVLSGLLFFSVVDSMHIVGRYVASAMLCKAVVKFELMGMNEGLDADVVSSDEIELTASTKGTRETDRLERSD